MRSADSVLRRRYRAYLFDLDGTLVDSAPDITSALNAALQSLDCAPVDEALTRSWVGHGSRVLIERALDHAGKTALRADDAVMARAMQSFIDYYSIHIADRSRPYPGVVDALDELRGRGSRLAIVTNKLEQLSVKLLAALELADYFEAIVGGDTLVRRKPSAEPALHACAQLRSRPDETLFVGDSLTDVETARAAGCPVVCVRGGYAHGASEELGADAIVDSLIELL